jgi:hypothetical protein
MIYFKWKMIGFAIIIVLNAFWFYATGYIPTKGETLILMTVYMGFVLNGIGIKSSPSIKSTNNCAQSGVSGTSSGLEVEE